ncbi:hypothetical protein ACA910_020961 [Epithemia clementina (nom. ined.)]
MNEAALGPPDDDDEHENKVASTGGGGGGGFPTKKRRRVGEGLGEDGTGGVVPSQQQKQQHQQTAIRSSSLRSPTLQLTGHTGSVYALEYSPNGTTLCSASFDKTLLLWSHSDQEYDDDDDNDDASDFPTGNNHNDNNSEDPHQYHNFNVLTGHKNAVLDCHWMDNDTVVSASADKTVMLWDVLTGQRLRKWTAESIVNCCTVVSPYVAASAGDDGSCQLWDRRQKRPALSLPRCSDFAILALCAAAETGPPAMTGGVMATHLFTSGIDSKITCWDLKMLSAAAAPRKVYAMTGHVDTVTGLSLHPDGTHLLSNAMDSTLKIWDIRPFVTGKRQTKEMVGHRHSAEKGLLKCAWSKDGTLVTAGSADAMVHVWDEFTAQELYVLPGHKGCVNTVVFHPKELTVLASGASDKHIFVGELSL